MIDFERRVTRVHVTPVGEPIYHERGYSAEIDDEAGGEFVVVRDNGDGRDSIAIDPRDWPMLRAAIDKMIGECRV